MAGTREHIERAGQAVEMGLCDSAFVIKTHVDSLSWWKGFVEAVF